MHFREIAEYNIEKDLEDCPKNNEIGRKNKKQ